jgi:hypothetical protein
MAKNNRKVVSIVDMWGNPLPIEKMEFWFVGDDYAIGHYKGYGFDKKYASCDGYTVITEEV